MRSHDADRLSAPEIAQRLLERPPKRGNEKPADDTEAESQAAGYFTMVRGKFEMPLRICEGSHRTFHVLHQSRVKERRRVGAMPLVKVPLFSVLAVNDDPFHVGPAWTDGNKAFTCATDIIRFCVHFMRQSHSLPDGITTFRVSNQGFCSHRLLVKMTRSIEGCSSRRVSFCKRCQY